MALSRFGMAIATMMPMIATTIRSSISVKPFWFLFIWDQPPPVPFQEPCRAPNSRIFNDWRRPVPRRETPRRIFVGGVEGNRTAFVTRRRRPSVLGALRKLHESSVHQDDVGVEIRGRSV